MDTSIISELIKALFRELYNFRRVAVAVFVMIAFAVLLVGMITPKSYETSAMLHADVTNIIEPLLKGRAHVTTIDRSEQARENIYTRRIIERVAREAGLITGEETVEELEDKINGLRARISIKSEAPNYFRVTYRDGGQDRSFRVLNTVIDTFIKDAAERKRSESRSAYEFINEQVNTYKRQLKIAEERLKEFKSENVDGDEMSVRRRIDNFRLQIEELKLQIDEGEARKASIEEQLASETQYLATKGKMDAYAERLQTLQTQLDDLLLSYQDTYPDVIAVRGQIRELEESMERVSRDGATVAPGGYSNTNSELENPLYEELRKAIAEVESNLRSQRKRKEVLQRLLEEEVERGKRVAARQAELSELTRDYDVTREIYEEMLERKEKARLSMNLDIEGQGVSYRIQEPAVYPLKPSGLRLVHYFVAGPIVAFAGVIALCLGFIMLDPRVRTPSQLMHDEDNEFELLGVIPGLTAPSELAQRRVHIRRVLIALAAAMVVYVAAAAIRFSGLV